MKRAQKAGTAKKALTAQAARKTQHLQKRKVHSDPKAMARAATTIGWQLRTSPRRAAPRGYDDRLAASDKPSPGRTAMLGIMARAAEGIIKLYRSENFLDDLFGNRTRAVALTTIDDKDIFGSNSTSSSTYKDADFRAAIELRDKLVEKYPTVMSVDKLGETPNNALFHAETNVLLRAAEANNGTLAGRSLDIYVDRRFCGNCQVVIPLVGLELGNPTLTYVDPYNVYSIANGKITSRSKR